MNYIVYDTETTGAHVRYDKIRQFAAIKTDNSFQEQDFINVTCKNLSYILPNPDALLVTHVSPKDLDTPQMTHFEMMNYVAHTLESWGPACFIGYNIISYDEEIMRSNLWMNLNQPYITVSNGNCRADLLTIIRLAHTCDPTKIAIATHPETGNPSFKLDKLAPLNGFTNHNAHDALGDNRATIHMIRHVQKWYPDVWETMMKNSDPKYVATMADKNRVFTLVNYFGKPNVMRVTKLGVQTSNAKKIICFNLAHDPEIYLNKSPEDLRDLIGTPDGPFETFRTNAFPMAFSLQDLDVPETVPVDTDIMIERLTILQNNPKFKDAVIEALDMKEAQYDKKEWLEEKIYDGFPSYEEKRKVDLFQKKKTWDERYKIIQTFQDEKLKSIGLRLVYENAPHLLPEKVRTTMSLHILENRLLTEEDVPWNTFKKSFDAIAQKQTSSPEIEEIVEWLKKEYEKAVNTVETLKDPEKKQN